MARTIRARANFAEHVPLARILIGLPRWRVFDWIIHVPGRALVLARILSALGMNRLSGSTPRQAGAGITTMRHGLSIDRSPRWYDEYALSGYLIVTWSIIDYPDFHQRCQSQPD